MLTKPFYCCLRMSNDMAGKLPPEDYDSNTFKAMYMQVEALFKKIPNYSSEPEQGSSLDKPFLIHEGPANLRDQRTDGSGVCVDGRNHQRSSSKSANSYRERHSDEEEAELIEQFEPGVCDYCTTSQRDQSFQASQIQVFAF